MRPTPTPSTYPPHIEWMHRYRWLVFLVGFVVFVFYLPEWPAQDLIAALALWVALAFLNSRWGYRVYFAFREGWREPASPIE